MFSPGLYVVLAGNGSPNSVYLNSVPPYLACLSSVDRHTHMKVCIVFLSVQLSTRHSKGIRNIPDVSRQWKYVL
jgi:hypothetical protein